MDIAALSGILQAVGFIALNHPEIAEIDLVLPLILVFVADMPHELFVDNGEPRTRKLS